MRSIRPIAILIILVVAGFPVSADDSPQTIELAQRWTLESTVLEESREIFVSTPAGYETGKNRYPVIYLTDGAGHLHHTVGTARYLAETGWLPELIVVGITQGDRMNELTPTRGKPLPWPGGIMRDFPTAGGGERFLEFVASEVIPFVETKYRTQPYRILAGHSAGGLFSAYAMVTRPDLFDALIAASPAFRWDDEWIVKESRAFFAERNSFDKAFFMTVGDDEPMARPSWDHFRDMLAGTHADAFRWDTLILAGENHPSMALRSYYFGLKMIFDIWPVARDKETGDYIGGLDGVVAHFAKVSERYGFEVAPPEIVLYILGARARRGDNLEEAIRSFELAVNIYSETPYLYDQLGDALEASGRLQEARKNYERAVELGTDADDPRLVLFKANLERVRKELAK